MAGRTSCEGEGGGCCAGEGGAACARDGPAQECVGVCTSTAPHANAGAGSNDLGTLALRSRLFVLHLRALDQSVTSWSPLDISLDLTGLTSRRRCQTRTPASSQENRRPPAQQAALSMCTPSHEVQKTGREFLLCKKWRSESLSSRTTHNTEALWTQKRSEHSVLRSDSAGALPGA